MYKVGDRVKVVFDDLAFIGEIYVFDRHGTFMNPGVPSVDVYWDRANILYKHITLDHIFPLDE